LTNRKNSSFLFPESQIGRETEPSAALIDSQSVKTTERGGIDGYDGGKNILGRKQHLLVDTVGLSLKAKGSRRRDFRQSRRAIMGGESSANNGLEISKVTY